MYDDTAVSSRTETRGSDGRSVGIVSSLFEEILHFVLFLFAFLVEIRLM